MTAAGMTSVNLDQPASGFAPWPLYAEDERAAADAVLSSGKVNYWTGQHGRAFEQEYAAHSDTKYAVAVANGSLALELVLRCWGIGPGDEVVVTPRSFIASASCVVLQGAKPVFADVDLDSGNLTAETIDRVLTKRTRALIPVHLAGWPCDMDAIVQLAEARGLKVLEDCAQAHGARFHGRPVGGLGHAGAFSFCQDKIITTAGEGGMLTTDDESLWRCGWSFKDHGKSWKAVYERQHLPGFRWLHESIGSNWRLTEVQAAIGRRQLTKLADWSALRRRYAQCYLGAFKSIPALRVPVPPTDVEHGYYKFYAYVRPERLKTSWSRDRIMAEINARGVPCFAGSCSEIYLEKAFETLECRPRERLKAARQLGETSLMFLVHPTLVENDVMEMADVAANVIRGASR